MTTIVIMPGGFHPFHAGHYALYQSAQRTFPDAEVYVAATNDTSSRPFPFPVKEKLAKLAGVEAGHFVQVKSPFKAEEITAKFNPNRDTLIFVRSEKDSTKPPQPGGVKKDGSPSYLQPLLGAKKLEPFSKHAYMAYLPTVEFGPGMTSATQIRAAWPTLNERRKTALVMSLYPKTQTNPKLAQTVVKLLDAAIGGQEVEEDISRRGFLRGLGAAAVAGAAGSAMAQSRPVDVSREFQNMRQDDPRVQHNKDIEEMARAIYEQIVATRGQPIDRRQQQMWMDIARERATQKLAKYAPGRPAPQSQSSGFPAQGSERRVSRNIDNFESQGVAEGLDEAVGGNYLYHATSPAGLNGILQSGYIGAQQTAQPATDAQTKLPSVAVTRDWNYASGSARSSEGVGQGAVIVLDRNSIESKYKTFGSSQSWMTKGLPNATADTPQMKKLAQQTKFKDANKNGKLDYDELPAGAGGAGLKQDYFRPKSGGEAEEAVVVPKGKLPLQGSMVGFWVDPNSELTKDPTIMNDPRRLDMVRPNQFVKATQQQGVAEGAPIVVAQAPIDVRNPKKAPQPYRDQGDIVPPTKPPSTEKRGVKGRPGQRPMPKYDKNNDYLDE